MNDESIVLETRHGQPFITVPQESPEFAKLAGATFRYLEQFGLTEVLKALDTMQTTVKAWDEFNERP